MLGQHLSTLRSKQVSWHALAYSRSLPFPGTALLCCLVRLVARTLQDLSSGGISGLEQLWTFCKHGAGTPAQAATKVNPEVRSCLRCCLCRQDYAKLSRAAGR